MRKPRADRTIFSQIRAVFARAGLDDAEILEVSITMVAVFARVLGVPRSDVLKRLEERVADASLLDPREQAWTTGPGN
jgi:hypothetical protein